MLPTKETVTWTLKAEQDEMPVRGNAMASGDDEADRKYEDEIIDRLSNDDIWAWAQVTLIGTWHGLTVEDHLGACTYKNEAEFKAGIYYTDMQEEVIIELTARAQEVAEAVNS